MEKISKKLKECGGCARRRERIRKLYEKVMKRKEQAQEAKQNAKG